MNFLDKLTGNARLYTYKVMHDGGSAPNPYNGLCTLAICKPRIRTIAKPGDVIVGFAASPNDKRIIYCMVVNHSIAWSDYIDLCTGQRVRSNLPGEALQRRVPRSATDPGDCIWPNASEYMRALPSWSTHRDPGEFESDVRNGKNVLLATQFWYFGKGDRHDIRLPQDLSTIVPNRGHRSNANTAFREQFVNFFNDELRSRNIPEYGNFGTPAIEPLTADEAQRQSCRRLEIEDDIFSEEHDSSPSGCARC